MLIMITRPNHRLPATIASRCLRLVIKPPPHATALQWLQRHTPADTSWEAALALAGGAPLRAMQYDAAGLAGIDSDMRASLAQLAARGVDASVLAERWLRSDPVLRITWLENWITQRVRGTLGGAASLQTAEPVGLPAALLKPKIRALYELLDAARDFRRLASTGMNQQLALEALLIGGGNAFAD